jgi:hypothetical protein
MWLKIETKNYRSLKWLEKWIFRSEIYLQNPWQPAYFANPCYKTQEGENVL